MNNGEIGKSMAKSKKEYEKLLLEMAEPLKSHYSEGKARLDLGVTAAGYGNKIAGMEGFSRVLWGMAPYWAGGGKDESLVSIYQEGIKNGTDPKHKEYWGHLHDKDQRMVEMAALSLGILLTPEKLWEPLPEQVKQNYAAWLNEINQYKLVENNWQFFNVITNLALKSVGMEYSKTCMQRAIDYYESFYIGNGWYGDGKRPQKDYYVPFAIHFYCLLYVKFMRKEDPDRCKIYEGRAKEFAKTFLYWFDDEGKALPYGRSQTYRFAQVAFFSACAFAEVEVFPLSVIKGIIERHLDYWLRQPIFDNGHILTVGYTYPNLNMSETYNATGSPYWAWKTFLFLALPASHPFWQVEAAPFPNVQKTLAIPECNMLIQHRKGEVTALCAGQYPVVAHMHSAEKYAKFAYSSVFGFSVPRSYEKLAETAPDSMLAFCAHGMTYVRRKCEEFYIKESEVYARWIPVEGIEVETWLYPTEEGHRRKHKITSSFSCKAYDCGFSYPSRMEETKKESKDGLAEVSDQNGFSKVVLKKGSGIGTIIGGVSNVNLIFPNAWIPALEYEITPGIIEVECDIFAKLTIEHIIIGKGECYGEA